ncbi:MAG: LysR family transcriptional regulator [Lachnospiraceae bacterium]|nr:LysR family transcriptional regulator [Lachnospiraceae bacterium]
MTITQLTTFIKIAELESFSAAANSLGYAQSTVTTQIKQLEEELGCPLFERLGKTILLTSAGEKLTSYAKRMVQLEREIRLEVSDGDEPSGVLKIGVSESLCISRLPKILMEYKKDFPGMEIRIQFINHENILDMLKKGELDLVYTLNPEIADDSVLLLDKQREYLGFYAAPGYFPGDKKLSEADLHGLPLLLTGHNCNFRHMLVEDLEKNGINPVIALETSSKEVLKQFAKNGLGLAFIPDITAESERKKGSLVRLSWYGNDFPVFAQVLVHKDKHINRAIVRLVEIIKIYNKEEKGSGYERVH